MRRVVFNFYPREYGFISTPFKFEDEFLANRSSAVISSSRHLALDVKSRIFKKRTIKSSFYDNVAFRIEELGNITRDRSTGAKML